MISENIFKLEKYYSANIFYRVQRIIKQIKQRYLNIAPKIKNINKIYFIFLGVFARLDNIIYLINKFIRKMLISNFKTGCNIIKLKF